MLAPAVGRGLEVEEVNRGALIDGDHGRWPLLQRADQQKVIREAVSRGLWENVDIELVLSTTFVKPMRPTVQTVGSGGLNQSKLKLYRQLIVGSDIKPSNQQLDWFN